MNFYMTHLDRDFYILAHANVPRYRFFFKVATQKGDDLLRPKRQKWGVTDLVLERICPEEHPKSESIGLL